MKLLHKESKITYEAALNYNSCVREILIDVYKSGRKTRVVTSKLFLGVNYPCLSSFEFKSIEGLKKFLNKLGWEVK